MIGHDDKGIKRYVRESLSQVRPASLDELSGVTRQHLTFHDGPKDKLLVQRARGHEICALTRIVMPSPSDRAPVMDLRIVRHKILRGRSKQRPYDVDAPTEANVLLSICDKSATLVKSASSFPSSRNRFCRTVGSSASSCT